MHFLLITNFTVTFKVTTYTLISITIMNIIITVICSSIFISVRSSHDNHTWFMWCGKVDEDVVGKRRDKMRRNMFNDLNRNNGIVLLSIVLLLMLLISLLTNFLLILSLRCTCLDVFTSFYMIVIDCSITIIILFIIYITSLIITSFTNIDIKLNIITLTFSF